MEWNGRKDAEHGGSNDAVEGWVEGTDTVRLVGGDTGMECWVGEIDTGWWVGDMET